MTSTITLSSPLSEPSEPSTPPSFVPALRDHPDMVRRKELVIELEEGITIDESKWSKIHRYGAGTAGQDKNRTPLSTTIANLSVYGPGQTKYGEDTAVVMDQGDFLFMGTFDGHGGTAVVSRQCAHAFALSITPEFKNALMAKDAETLFQMNSNLHQTMHDAVYVENGGSTLLTTCIHTTADGEVIVLTSNMGDSGGFFVNLDTGHILVVYTSHIWEVPTEYKSYVRYCNENGITPMQPVYSRINIGGISFPDQDGEYRPFALYENDENGEIILHQSNRDYVWTGVRKFCIDNNLKFNMGGLQTEERSIQQIQNPDGSWRDHAHHPDHAHENWGSVGVIANKEIQMTRAIGDVQYPLRRESSHRLFSVPSDWKRFVYIQGSDGFLDAYSLIHHSDNVRHIVDTNPYINGQGIANLLIAKLMEGVGQWTVRNGKPMWDDVHVIAERWERMI